jgi:predicted lipoprotein with Yx(FWY)xxD motif
VKTTLITVAAIGVLTLAGCSSGSGNPSSAADSSGTSATTVTIRDVGGGQVLASPDGRTLYVSDQEKGKVLCASSGCEAIWTPLTLSSGSRIKAPAGLDGQLGTVQRPDGSAQVALDGRPLYTFSLDHTSGQANGDGATDSFDGVDFTWHTATPTGSAPAPTKSPSSGGAGYGGYGY